MRVCPVCESKCDTLVCSRCGFDGSRDYERWPTLGRLGGPVESVAGRKKNFADLTLCADCDGTGEDSSAVGTTVDERVSGEGEFTGEKKSRRWKWLLGPIAACLLVMLAFALYHPRDGWYEKYGNTYFYKDGHMAVGMEKISDDVYYFNSDGSMHTGWLMIDHRAYYFNDEGIMQTGLVEIGGEPCYFDENGVYDHEKMLQGNIETDPAEKHESSVPEPTGKRTPPTVAETTAPETIPTTTPPPYIPPVYTPPETTPSETAPRDDPNWFMCSTCVGRGKIYCYCVHSGSPGVCSICGGTGIYHMIADSETQETISITCYYCNGQKVCPECKGVNYEVICEECDGNGGYYWTP